MRHEHLTRFINHSYGPNCYIEEMDHKALVPVSIFACRTIRKGEGLPCNSRMTCSAS